MSSKVLFQTIKPESIRRVAVIGAGPVGSAVTKALIKEAHFDKIKVFEKSNSFGGLWNYNKPLIKTTNSISGAMIPCEKPNVRILPEKRLDDSVIFQTPIYKHMNTNVPKDLMEYKGHRFPMGTPLFPGREEVLDYLVNYSKKISDYVTFNTEVTNVTYNDSSQEYTVRTENLLTKEKSEELFDAIVAANGFNDLPFVPSRPGLEEWHKTFPSSISHAKDFDCPDDFRNIKGEILIVGNSASASDLSYQLATSLERPIYKSARSQNEGVLPPVSSIKNVPDIKHFVPETRSVAFVDGSELKNVEKIIYCTGYMKSMPFLPKGIEGQGNSVLANLITTGTYISGLFNHITSIELPTFAVIGLPRFIPSTRLSETQGAWLSRVWSGRISLPPFEVQQKYHNWSLMNNGDGSTYHDLNFPQDVQYVQRLNREIRHAGNGGFFGVEWRGDQIKLRSSMNELKKAYQAYYQETGKCALTIDELIDAGYFQWPSHAKSCIQIPTFVP